MEVRRATHDDANALAVLGAFMHSESPRYRHLDFEPQKVIDMTHALLDNEYAVVLVVEHEGFIVGMFAGIVAQHYFCFQLYSSDIVFYVAPEHRGSRAGVMLLREWERVIAEDGRVVESVIGVSADIDPDRVCGLLERLGYRQRGHIMVKSHVRS